MTQGSIRTDLIQKFIIIILTREDSIGRDSQPGMPCFQSKTVIHYINGNNEGGMWKTMIQIS